MAETRQAVGIVMPLGKQQGGAEALLQHFLRHGSEKHTYFCAFLEDGPLVDLVRALGYDTTVIPTTHLSHLGNYLKTVSALRSWIRRKKLRSVLSWMTKAHLYVSLAAFGQPVRVLWYQHGVPHGNTLDRLATLLPTDAVLCCSRTSKQAQDQTFPKRRTYVCYPGVIFPPDGTPPQSVAREALGLSSTGAVVGMVARLERWKGAHVFLDAANLIFEQHPDATLFLIGGAHPLDPAYAAEIESRAKQLDRPENFILAGQRPMAEALMWQAAADLIVHPAIGVEPFGMAIAEAMGQGRVVIASNIGGPSEIIEGDQSGILIDRNDPTLLATAVNRLLKDTTSREALAARAYVRGRTFSVPVFVARVDELMEPSPDTHG